MIVEVGTDVVTHHPTPMGRFGLNPQDAPLWRVVFADSVKRLIGGRWADGKEEYRLARVYNGPGAKGKWVLESWISAFEHTGCTAEEYRIKFQAPGCMTTIQNEPYPHQGTYVERFIFPGEPSRVDEVINRWNQQRDIGFAERRRAIQDTIDYNAKKTRESELYRLREAQPDPCGVMMLGKQKSGNLKDAKSFNLPGSGFRQVQGA